MSTQPNEDILPPSIEPKGFRELIELISSTLEELVNYGTHIIQWVGENPKFKNTDVDVPLLLFARHILQLVDSISILVSKSAIDPCKVLLRSALETMLYIIFITKEKSEDRSKAYLLSYIKYNKIVYTRFIRGTPLNKELQKKIKNDQIIKDGFNPFDQELDDHLQKKIDNLDEWIDKPFFSETKTEYNRMRKIFKRKPPWYLLYGGAENIEKLAEKLKYGYIYEVAYRKWSNILHASDVMTGIIATSKGGKGSFYQIRFGSDIIEVAKFAINISLTSYRTLIDFVVPQRKVEYNQWYKKEIKASFDKIMKTEVKLF